MTTCDEQPWLGLQDEHGEHFMVDPRSAWKIISRTDIGNETIMQIQNVAQPNHRASLLATHEPRDLAQ